MLQVAGQFVTYSVNDISLTKKNKTSDYTASWKIWRKLNMSPTQLKYVTLNECLGVYTFTFCKKHSLHEVMMDRQKYINDQLIERKDT